MVKKDAPYTIVPAGVFPNFCFGIYRVKSLNEEDYRMARSAKANP